MSIKTRKPYKKRTYKDRDSTYHHPLKIKCPYCLKENVEKWTFPWNMYMHVLHKHNKEELDDWMSKPKTWVRDKKTEEKRRFDQQVEEIRKEQLKGW